MAIGLTRASADKLLALFAQGEDGTNNNNRGKGGARAVGYILITDEKNDDGLYPCLASNWNEAGQEWDAGTATALAKPRNNEELYSGLRYLAVRSGDDGDGVSVWVCVGEPIKQRHVKVIGDPDEDGYYPCLPQVWDDETQGWESDPEALCFEPMSLLLVKNCRYMANYFDLRDGKKVYVTQAREQIACGLKIKEDGDETKGKLVVDVEAIAGKGLAASEVAEGDYDVCQTLELAEPGCGLKWDGDAYAVDVDSLVTGFAGISSTGDCGTLEAVPGCGITVGADGISVDVAALAGDGMEVYDASSLDPGDEDYDADACPQLSVKINADGSCYFKSDEEGLSLDLSEIAGCGMKEQAAGEDSESCSKLAVDLESIAGDGLAAVFAGEDCGRLEVEPGPGIEIADGAVTAVAGCQIVVDEEGISLDTDNLLAANSGLEWTADACPKLKLAGDLVCLEVIVPEISCIDGSISYATKWISFRGTVSDTAPEGCPEEEDEEEEE